MGAKSTIAGLARLEKMSKLLIEDGRGRASRLGPFLYVLTEKLNPKEKQALIKTTQLTKDEVDQWQKIEARSKKLEAALKAPRIRKASHVYHLVTPAKSDEVLFLLYHSTVKLRAGTAEELLPEVPAPDSGNHARGMGDSRREARNPQI